MNLKLVTWDGDLTQFLVDVDTDDKAISKAIKVNLKLGDCNDPDIKDIFTYSIEDVDFKFLRELFNRKDFSFIIEDVVVFGY